MGIKELTSSDNRILEKVLEQFSSTYPDCVVSPLGYGNINDTFLVTATAGKFVLQRISTAVFAEPLHVITNFRKISDHLQRKTDTMAPEWQCARPVYTDCGDLFYRDEVGGFWRGQTYLPHKRMVMTGDFALGYELGRALGFFHLLLSDIDGEDLHNPLPGFHVLPIYFEQFDLVWKKEIRAGRRIEYCRSIIEQYRGRAAVFEKAKKEGFLVLQPVHGDPKIDNFIFNETGTGVGMIDLDTVGSGLVQFDIGDCLRSCCNLSGEDRKKEQDVRFDMRICRAILDGYFQRAGTLLSSLQRRYIFDALLLITFELGLRFFTDHLLENSYFKIKAPGDNLHRAVTQFRLVGEIEKCEQEIRTITEV